MIEQPHLNLPWPILATRTDRFGTLFPIEGWPMPFIAELETANPGFLLHTMSAKAKWRQSFYLFLSVVGFDRAEEFLFHANGSDHGKPWSDVLTDLGQTLRALGPREIVTACLGNVPEGLAGALTKLGLRPMPSPIRYQKIVEVLSGRDAVTRLRAKTLTQLSRLDSDVLDVVLLVDPVGLIPDLIPRLGSLECVHRLNMVLVALRSIAGASDEALRHSLSGRATTFRLHKFIEGWLPKVSSLPMSCRALEEHPDFERIMPSTADEAGRRFSNCLSTKKIDLLTGVWSAWIWTPGDLIVALTEVEQGFVLSGVFGHDNFPPSDDHASKVREVLGEAGVICLNRKPVSDAVKPLLMRRWDNFELDDLEFA
jgi:hypothetical protein